MPHSSRMTHRAAAAIAGLVAGGAVVYQIVQSLVNLAFSLVGFVSSPEYFASLVGGYANELFSVWIPMAVGVFLTLWRWVPIEATLSIGLVVARGALATGIGAIAVLVVLVSLRLRGAFSGTGSFFANTFPELPWTNVGQSLAMAVQGGLFALMGSLPLVVLGTVFVWMWGQRHSASAMLDEV